MCPRRCNSCGNTTHCFPSFFLNTEQSRRTTLSRGTVHISSAGDEEAPCTNASHACTGSLLKRALNNLRSPAPGTPQVLEAHHGPSSRPPEAQDPLIEPSKMTACWLLSHKRSSAKRHGRATLLFSEEVFHAVADLIANKDIVWRTSCTE